MVITCAYPGCGKKQRKYNTDSFHRLPLRYDRALVDRWLVILNIDINTSTETLRQKNYRVCCAHFDENDFVFPRRAADPNNPLKIYLKKNAIPRVELLATDSVEPPQCRPTTCKAEGTEFEPGMCSVVGCDSSRRGVQRFKLPEDPERRLEWVQFLFEVNAQRLKESCWTDITICSEHFTGDCFEKLSPAGTLQLKPSVVPSLGPIKSELDVPLESPQSVEIPTGDSPGSAVVSVTVPFSDEESDPSDDSDEGGMSTDEEWTPTEEVLLAEELAEETDDTSEEEAESDSPGGLKIKELCTECGSFFNSLKGHTCEHKIKPYSCDICGKRCVTEISLKAHSRIHDETYQHPCKYCHVTFRTRVDKLKHEQIHQEQKDPYKCPDCPKTFSTSKARNIHLSNHRVPKEFRCGVCGIEFKDVHHLRRHSFVHTGLRPYKCSVCQRDFSQMSHLKSHMRLHTGERPYKCEHCDKCFNHNVSLKSHVQRYHTNNSGFARRKGKIDKRASDNGDSNENRRGTDSEIDNMEEEQNTEVEVQGEGIDMLKSSKRRTGRPRGRPKRSAAGKLILSGQNKDQRSNTSKTSKSKLQKLKKTGSSDEGDDGEQLDSNVSVDGEEGDEDQDCQTVRKSTGRSRRKPKNMTVSLIFTQKKRRYSCDNSNKSSGKRRGRPRKEIVV